MGLFSWVCGKPKEPVSTANFPGPGAYALGIVGESHYQENLEVLCGGRKENGHTKIAQATLVHEDGNPHDRMAIKVMVDEWCVGYLSRENARAYRNQLARIGYPGITATCSAMIVGGWDDGAGGTGHFGVRLDIPVSARGTIMPLLAKPRVDPARATTDSVSPHREDALNQLRALQAEDERTPPEHG